MSHVPAPSRDRGTARTGVVNLRVQPAERALIDRAAAARGKSRSEFMLEASRRAAEETLLDQTFFRIDPAAYARFLEMLDAPARPSPELRRLMQTRAPWE
jgi:uncharacterized protein (DUF1778 family)